MLLNTQIGSGSAFSVLNPKPTRIIAPVRFSCKKYRCNMQDWLSIQLQKDTAIGLETGPDSRSQNAADGPYKPRNHDVFKPYGALVLRREKCHIKTL